jgi:hypothetical protein
MTDSAFTKVSNLLTAYSLLVFLSFPALKHCINTDQQPTHVQAFLTNGCKYAEDNAVFEDKFLYLRGDNQWRNSRFGSRIESQTNGQFTNLCGTLD